MNHLIKLPILSIGLALVALSSGCGNSEAEKAAKERERQRIEQEKQAQADAEKANKAISANNQKMFSKMNDSTPGASSTNAPTPTK